MVALGIDVGIHGAWALIRGTDVLQLMDMPTREKPGNSIVRLELDAKALYDQLRFIIGQHKSELIVVAERLTGAGKGSGWIQGTSSLFSFGDSLGVVRAVLNILGVEPNWIMPGVWKRHFGLIKKKKRDSLNVARELFTYYDGLMRLKDHNRAEALLLARYGWLRYTS